MPVPDGYHVQSRTNRGLVVGGAVLFGNAYLLSFAGGLSVMADYNGDSRFAALLIPVVGPFITIGIAPDASLAKDNTKGAGTLLIIDGLAQLAGVALFAFGVTADRRVVVRNDLASSTAPEVIVGPTSASLRLRF